MLFLLKAGSHIVGRTGVDEDGKPTQVTYYSANDPNRRIVDSEEPLDELMPEKFEIYRGPNPGKPPPGVPTMPHTGAPVPVTPRSPSADVEALLARSMTADEKEKLAALLQQQSQRLQEEAKTAKQAAQQAVKEKQQAQKQASEAKQAQKEQAEAEQQATEEEEGPDGLDEMTVQDLRELADEEEVDYKTSWKKDELVQAIRSARSEEGE